jgi:V/A-type H+/Na+-transporting ATPase subunit E
MTGSERIREKILQDAVRAAEAALEAGRKEAESIRAEAADRRRLAEEETARRIDAALMAQGHRNAASLQLEARKQALAVRRRMVDEAFGEAAKAVAGLPDDQYRKMMTAMILENAWQGDAELVVSAFDRDRLGNGFPTEVEALCRNKGMAGGVRYSEDSLPVHGGFVLRTGDIEINGTLEVVLAGIRPKLERRVAEVLFGDYR